MTWLWAVAVAGEPVTLTVDIEGVARADGALVVRLFDAEDSWLESAEAVGFQKLAPADTTVTFPDLPRGDYAVSVVHDLDDDLEVTMQWLPWPKPLEGVATSRDPRPTLGPPSWDDARIELTGDTRIAVQLVY